MKKKYIVELPDSTEWIQWIMKGKDGHPYMDFKQVEDITPYTEPDKDALDNAYAHGYSDAKAESYDEKDKIYDEARGRGYKEGQARGYQEGLFDAWEVARKIWEYDIGTLHEIYDPIGMRVDCFTKFTASEAIAKIAEYEKAKEESIKVGDEVISEDATKAVVLDMDDYLLHVLDENGVMQGWPREDVAKTDRHFPEIAEVLRKMGEVQ